MFKFFLSTILMFASLIMAETIDITNREQFLKRTVSLSINPQPIQLLTINDQIIDEAFNDKFSEVFQGRSISNLKFDRCIFPILPGLRPDFSFLNELSLTSLTINNCGLTDEDFEDILSYLQGHTERELDFSNNNLGVDKNKFEQVFLTYFYGQKFALDSINLSGNPALKSVTLSATHAGQIIK